LSDLGEESGRGFEEHASKGAARVNVNLQWYEVEPPSRSNLPPSATKVSGTRRRKSPQKKPGIGTASAPNVAREALLGTSIFRAALLGAEGVVGEHEQAETQKQSALAQKQQQIEQQQRESARGRGAQKGPAKGKSSQRKSGLRIHQPSPKGKSS
jgi:hypothetical protein